MKLEDLIVRLRIEEDNKTTKKKATEKSALPEENNVETSPNKKRKKFDEDRNAPEKKKFKEIATTVASLAICLQIIVLLEKIKKKDQANMNEDIDNLCACYQNVI